MSIDPQAYTVYYKRLLPFKSLFAWLNHQHTPTRLFTHREWAFTVSGDVYLRWNSFNTVDEFKKEVLRLNPSRFEVGAIYTGRPKDKKTLRASIFGPTLRELVFDIDMTDYDEVRTCCSDKIICKRCWGFMASACDVLDHVLRREFGYKHILWVFSGRRGIHCWVSDNAAMALSDESRKALVQYLELVKGGVGIDKRVNTRFGKSTAPMHPMLSSALDSLRDRFADLILDDQDCFKNKEGWEKLLKLLPVDEDVLINDLRDKWAEEDGEGSPSSSSDKWADLKAAIRKTTKDNPQSSRKKYLQIALEDIVLQYMYPRIDSEVSKKRNHLLKAPFCIHPATGNICVPIDPAEVHNFDPNNVPTIHKLIEELDRVIVEDGAEHHSDWEQTSLRPYVQLLDKHVQGLMREVRTANKAAAHQSLEF